MQYVPRVRGVEAVQHTGDVDQLIAAANLSPQAAPDGRRYQVADGVSPHRSFAVWNTERSTWDYARRGDWVVVSVLGAFVMKDDDFQRHYERRPR